MKQKIEETVERSQGQIDQEVADGQLFESTEIHCTVLSYTHSPVFKDPVLALRNEPLLYLAITTEDREGEGGKLWALCRICHPTARVIHVDDSPEVLQEIQTLGDAACEAVGRSFILWALR